MNYENFLEWIESTSIYKSAKYKKAKSRAVAFTRFIPFDTKLLLDFGCGNMYLDKLLAQNYPNLKIIGLDIVKHHDLDNSGFPNLTFQLYDGHLIPFPDQIFDCSLAVGALHHTDDPKKYLKELIRVTKSSKDIIILEHTYVTALKWLFLQLNDRIRNYIFKPEIKGPLNYLSESQWNQIFHDLSLEVKEVRKVKPFSSLVNQVLFSLSTP